MSRHHIAPSPRPFVKNHGFTLLETVIATGILVTALAGLAQLVILATHLTRQANTAGAALIAAQDKLEVLASLRFDYDEAAIAVTSPSLEASPASSLDEDLVPYVDWIDPSGDASANPVDAVFARRWRVTSLNDDVPDAVAVEVCVFRMPAVDVAAAAADACLATVRTRQP
jgi:type II secretory pathway pseudopilin PulG